MVHSFTIFDIKTTRDHKDMTYYKMDQYHNYPKTQLYTKSLP